MSDATRQAAEALADTIVTLIVDHHYEQFEGKEEICAFAQDMGPIIAAIEAALQAQYQAGLGAWQHAARSLAVLALQSARYGTDEEYQQAVDAVLAATRPDAPPPAATP